MIQLVNHPEPTPDTGFPTLDNRHPAPAPHKSARVTPMVTPLIDITQYLVPSGLRGTRVHQSQ